MLEMTLETTFVPGANLKGDVAGANWSFLLSSLEVGQTLCIGLPPAAWLPTLARLSSEVVVVCANGRESRQAQAAIQRQGVARTRVIRAANRAALPFPNGSAGLVTLASRNGARQLDRDWGLLAELQRVLKPEGVMYLELEGETLHDLSEGFGPPQLFWLSPERGEAHTAVLRRDPETIRYFLHYLPAAPALDLRLWKPGALRRGMKAGLELLRAFGRGRPRFGSASRSGALIMRGSDGLGRQPPRYLCGLAQQAGVDITSCRWGLSASSEYTSRKVLFFLFKPASQSPDYVVKMVRDPALNRRLENETRALSLLWEKGLGEPEVLPRVMFFGQHARLAILGETMLEGLPFRQRTHSSVDCPYARAAIDWLTRLGAATADHTSAAPDRVADALEMLLARFLQLYSLPADERLFLANQIRSITHLRAPFPLVFQHGDPGLWNLLVTPRGQVAFLDWEAAEPQGMPLWDLFYFLRSYSIWIARRAGRRASLAGFTEQFLAPSRLTPLILGATQQYCERINLPPSLVAPLFYTCWMHRALKEATRLPPDRLQGGHYVRLLRHCIEQHQAPTLERIFSLPGRTGSASSTTWELEEARYGA